MYLVWKAINEAVKGVEINEHFKNATQTKINEQELSSDDAEIVK